MFLLSPGRSTAVDARNGDLRHIGSHRSLLPRVRGNPNPSRRGVIQAVVVPASRPASNLGHSAEVARLAGATLVVLASRKTDPVEAFSVASKRLPPERCIVVPFPDEFLPLGLEFEADKIAAPIERRDVDTSAKRNTALVLALLLGWKRLLFLDDDVRGFGRRELGLIEAGFRPFSGRAGAVGWAFDHFPDNSVVCHANRVVGGDQATFVGAGALGVQLTRSIPHFPRVYNEDWMFLWPLMRDQRVAMAGSLRQLPYEPFTDPSRARRQEFGDLLAEGLLMRAHLGGKRKAHLRPGYWREVMTARDGLIESIRTVLPTVEGVDAEQILACLDAADAIRRTIEPSQLSQHMEKWRGDLIAWSDALAALPRKKSVEEALQHLELGAIGVADVQAPKVRLQRHRALASATGWLALRSAVRV